MQLHRKEDLTENKLILLYAIRGLGASVPLTALSDLTAGRDWMLYFDMRQHLLELCEAGFLRNTDSPESYALTGQGLSALEMYKKNIPFSIRSQIGQYAREHGEQIVRQTEIRADYTQDSDAEFPVTLSLLDNGTEIFRLHLTAPDREEARRLCGRFESEGARLYAEMIHRLTRDDE